MCTTNEGALPCLALHCFAVAHNKGVALRRQHLLHMVQREFTAALLPGC